MLAPHHREDAELGHVWHTAEDRDDVLELFLGQSVFGGKGGGNVDIDPSHVSLLRSPDRRPSRAVPPGSNFAPRSASYPPDCRAALQVPYNDVVRNQCSALTRPSKKA